MGPITKFTARTESRNGVVRIALGGELDMAAAPALREELDRVEQDGVAAVMLDLRDLTFIDSSGLHVFLQAKNRARLNGHRVILVGATPLAERLFELTGTQFLLDGEHAVSWLDKFTGGRSTGAARDPAPDGDVGV